MLSATARPYIDASIAVLRQHGHTISQRFYQSMFAAHPELNNLFNLGNQASGAQPQSLAASVLAYASHIDQPDALAPVPERIVHKHAAVGITPAHYPIVGRHLLGAIQEVLGEAASPALDGVSMALHPGETVALVGPSGAGKTTLINLLPRFIEPTAGTLRLDGIALADWDVHALRRQFALVSQDVVLFNDSIAANVALGQTLDRERVRAALAGANLLEHVDTLPQGIDTEIGHNGSRLSGGQRQRLAIARAIYKDAPILILDEATSALDSESERLVQDALERLMQGRTSIVIAHRLSTIERADRIVALDGGRVVEQGTHAALLAAGGLYARLHALQFRSPA